MRSRLAIAVALVLATSCAERAGSVSRATHDDSATRAIFDGRSLDGWDGDARFWSVEDGAIVGRSSVEQPCKETTYLVWRGGEVGDFELALEFKIEGGNSGVQFRSRARGRTKVEGYQADIEDGPSWTGCLYEQDGRGVMATRGERVLFGPARSAVVIDDAAALLDRVRPHDWNEYVIRAAGERIELEINGTRMLEVVDHDASRARRRGVIALQLHAGAPMRVAFRNLRLRQIEGAPESLAPVVPVPVAADLAWSGEPPQWIWTRAEAADGELAAFAREFEVPFDVARATVRVTGDDHVRVFLDGRLLRQHDAWWDPVELDATRMVSRGTNVVVLAGKNDGSLAAVWLELLVTGAAGERLRLITDASWSARNLDDGVAFEDWSPAELDLLPASSAYSFGAVGAEPWHSMGPAMRGTSSTEPEGDGAALAASELELPDGFQAELLYTVPKEAQGSWVALCEDPRGRFYVSDQYGALYRVTTGADASATQVERVPLDLGSAHGLCWAFDSLYVVVADGTEPGSGLYRSRDTDGDDVLDSVQAIRKFDGGGEHGPHAVVLGPDRHLWIVGGNHTKLPEPIDVYRLPPTWGEDHLLPVIEDPNGHAVGIRAPGGWVVRTDENGERWELWAGGMRNAYDIAFDSEGELFTYDSDMEWDMGAPWYKAPRVLHVVSGADFGWRSGTANWPTDYPDTLPSVCETGPASPTGVLFGTGAKFPERYQRALFALDWAYGTIYAVHLAARGASFVGEAEKFCTGKPFPVTDAVIARDGAMYVTTGGRKTQSGLYRVTWDGVSHPQTPAVVEKPFFYAEQTQTPVAWRQECELDHGVDTSSWNDFNTGELATGVAFHASHRDPFVRRAGMVALEQCRPSAWFSWNFGGVGVSIAALHVDPQGQRNEVLKRMMDTAPSFFDASELIDFLRLIELVVIRCAPLEESSAATLREKVERLYPRPEKRVNRELAMLLVALESPKVIEPLLATMEGDAAQEEKIHAAYCLRALKSGWSLEQRRRFFVAMDELRATAKGGHSLAKYLDIIREQAADTLNDDERRELGSLVASAKPIAAGPIEASATFVRRWTSDALLPELREPLRERSFEHGRRAYAKASCTQCHRIGGEGGATGPDLTGAGSRFSRSDLLEALLEPSKAISDQYQDVELLTRDGDLYVGRIEREEHGLIALRRLPPNEDLIELDSAQIASRRRHALSRMPSGLLDVLTRDEVLDLFAYVLSGGNANDAAFAR